MKVLHISPEAPGYQSGGTLGVLQSLLMLKQNNCCVDYIGPSICDEKIISNYSKCTFLKKSNNFFDLVRTLLHGQTNKRYLAWKRMKYDFSVYDCIYLDFSKQDYVVRTISRFNIPIVVRVHNVEYDYSHNEFKKAKTFRSFCVSLLSKRKEKYIFKKANDIITLTDSDKQRIFELYNVDKNVHIIPVCLDSNEKFQNSLRINPSNILINGSLWYGPNLDGLNWFLKTVYPHISSFFKLIVAGSNPPLKLINACKELGVQLIPNPKTMKDCYNMADIFAVPIFSGAGMKVKIAEALSFGKIIISTSYGAIGYEISDGINGFICDTADEFIACIDKLMSLTADEKARISQSARLLFEKKYSISHGSKLLERIIKKYGRK